VKSRGLKERKKGGEDMSLETTKGYPPQGENYEEWRNVGKIG
jgi:hypothetical protein